MLLLLLLLTSENQRFTHIANVQIDKISFGLTMSLPDEESEHADDDDEWC